MTIELLVTLQHRKSYSGTVPLNAKRHFNSSISSQWFWDYHKRIFCPYGTMYSRFLSTSASVSLPRFKKRIAFIKQNTRTNKHQPFCIMNRILLLKMKTIMLDALWPSQNPNPMNERRFQMVFFLSNDLVSAVCLPLTRSIAIKHLDKQKKSLFLILMCLLFNLLPVLFSFCISLHIHRLCFFLLVYNFNFNFIEI